MGLTKAFEEAAAERIPGDRHSKRGWRDWRQKQFSWREPISCVREELGSVRGQEPISSVFATVFKIASRRDVISEKETGVLAVSGLEC